MNRIQKAFENRKAFIPFIATGDPDPNVTEELVPAMAEVGADLIEIDIPFSDPMAERIMIQEAGMHALASGMTADKILGSVRRIRLKIDVPLAFITYVSPMFTCGMGKFMKQAVDCGVDALITPDIPFEEYQELLPACRQYGLVLIYLVAPTSRERAQAIARESEGFAYCVSPLGMTGVRKEITTSIREAVETVKQGGSVPCAIDFGISTPEQATEMAAQSDGVIISSVIVKIVTEYGALYVKPVCDRAYEMRQAMGAQEIIKGKRSVSGE